MVRRGMCSPCQAGQAGLCEVLQWRVWRKACCTSPVQVCTELVHSKLTSKDGCALASASRQLMLEASPGSLHTRSCLLETSDPVDSC